MQEGDGGEGGGEGNGKEPAPGSIDPEGKPDWCAEKFWDSDTKKVRAEVQGKAYNELEGKVRDTRDTVKAEVIAEMKAAAPEAYKVNLSKELNIPDNVEMDLDSEDVMVQWFFEMAKESGFTQETVDKWLNGYIGKELAALPDMAKEIEKLGDHGQDRMLRVHNWLETKLSDDQFKSMNSLLNRADQVEALETLMKSSGPADFDSDKGSTALTRAELKTMQDDPRYHQQKDPVFIKRVTDGYKLLAKNL